MNRNFEFGNQLVSVRAEFSPVYRTIVENDEQFNKFFQMAKEEIEKDGGKDVGYQCVPESEILEEIKNFQDTFTATGKEWRTLPLWDKYENLIAWYASFKTGKVYFDNDCLSYN